MKLQTGLLFFAFIFISVALSNCTGKIDARKVDHLQIHYVELIAEAPFSVSCEAFESQFGEGIQQQIVNDLTLVSWFTDFINMIKKSPDTSVEHVDTRMVIDVYYREGDQVDKICVGKGRVTMNGEKYLLTPDLEKALWNLVSGAQ